MKLLLTAVLFILTLDHSFGQQVAVSGRVLDGQGGAVPFATVALLAAPDLAVAVAGRADEQGAYQLRAKRGGTYRVMATAVGFAKGTSAALPWAMRPCGCQIWCWERWRRP